MLKATRGPDIFVVAEMIFNTDVIQHSAQAANGDAHAVRAAEAAELAAAF